MTLKTSLIITGDASVAQAEVAALTQSLGAIAPAAGTASASAKALATANKDTAGTFAVVAASAGSLAPQMRSAVDASQRLVEQQKKAVDTTGLQRAGYAQLGAQLQDITSQLSTGTSIFTILAQQGGQIASAIAMIAPQAATAAPAMDQVTEGASEIGSAAVESAEKFVGFSGAIGRAATFMAGPWGAIVLAAGTVLGSLAWEAFNAGDAVEELSANLAAATAAADSYGTAQALLGKAIDLTTGKLKTQNLALIQSIRLQADQNILAAQARRKDNLGAVSDFTEPTMGEVAGDFWTIAKNSGTAGSFTQSLMKTAIQRGNLLGPVKRDLDAYTAAARAYAAVLDDAKSSPAAIEAAGQRFDRVYTSTMQRLESGAKRAGRDEIEAKRIANALAVDLNDQRANLLVVNGIDGKGVDARLKPWERPDKPNKPKKPPSTAARDEFGRDTADKVASIIGEFSDAPDIIAKTNDKVRELDDIIDDLGRRKPPNFGALIDMVERAKVVVRDGLIRDVAEAFDKPKTLADRAAVAIGELDAAIVDLSQRRPVDWEATVAGAEAAKSRIAQALNEPLAQYLREADEASRITGLLIAGRDQEAEAMRTILQLEKERGPLTKGQKDAVRESVAARREEAAILARIQRTQALYLDGSREIAGTIDDATQAWVRGDLRSFLQTPAKLVDSFAQVKGRELFEGLFGQGFADLERALTEGPVEKSARAMAGQMDGAGTAAAQMGGALDRAAPAIDAFVRSVSGGGSAAVQVQPAIDAYMLARFGRGAVADDGEITVTGQRPDRPRMSTEQLFTTALTKAGTSIADIFTSKDTAGRIGSIIGEKATGAIKGASEGAAVAGVANMLGIKMSGGGSQIGGALGGLTGLPGGSIIGSILGGLVGNALTGPTRSGYASLGTDAGGTTITAISGGKNSEGRRTEAVGYANTVMDRLGQIAGSLGGTLAGGLNLGTIGTQGEKFVFDRDGAGSAEGIKVDSLQEAVAEALRNAVVEGAVTGVSEAVKRALGSGKDIERAVSEAGAVRALETSLGGIGGAIKQQFDDFASVAAERVRIAKGYGLDLLAVERKNAEDRNRIAEQLVKAQVGSLQSLIQQMTTGDLAEGSAMDKLAALDDAIVKAKADLREGVDGAGDVLAQLYQQRLSTTKDAYATTGQYAAERDRVLTEARAAIAQATARVDAGKGSDPALATTNAAITAGNQLTDEGNDILAEIRSEIRELTNLTRGAPQPRRDFVSMLELSRV